MQHQDIKRRCGHQQVANCLKQQEIEERLLKLEQKLFERTREMESLQETFTRAKKKTTFFLICTCVFVVVSTTAIIALYLSSHYEDRVILLQAKLDELSNNCTARDLYIEAIIILVKKFNSDFANFLIQNNKQKYKQKKLRNQVDDLEQTLRQRSTWKLMKPSIEQLKQQLQTEQIVLHNLIVKLYLESNQHYFTFDRQGYSQAQIGYYVSPTMYTYPGGYSFEVLVNLKESPFVQVTFESQDCYTKPVARFIITLQLENKYEDKNHFTKEFKWLCTHIHQFFFELKGQEFISHADLKWNATKQTQYLDHDWLTFRVTNITIVERGYAHVYSSIKDSPPYDITFVGVQAAKEWNDFIDSPPMYTHPSGGYEFKLRLFPNSQMYYNTGVEILILSYPDSKAQASETLHISFQLLNQQNGKYDRTRRISWTQAPKNEIYSHFIEIPFRADKHIKDDILQMKIAKIETGPARDSPNMDESVVVVDF